MSLQNESFPPDRSFGFLPSNSFQPMSDALYELQVHSVPSVYTFMYMCAYLVKFRMLSGTGTGTVCAYVRTYVHVFNMYTHMGCYCMYSTYWCSGDSDLTACMLTVFGTAVHMHCWPPKLMCHCVLSDCFLAVPCMIYRCTQWLSFLLCLVWRLGSLHQVTLYSSTLQVWTHIKDLTTQCSLLLCTYICTVNT